MTVLAETGDALLEVKGLVCSYDGGGAGADRGSQKVRAVNDISFAVMRGETFGLVGESGCGKSTAAKAVVNTHRPDAGDIRYDGVDLLALDAARWKRMRRRIQYVAQNPLGALDPRMRVLDQLIEPMAIHNDGSSDDRRERGQALMRSVGLGEAMARRFPHELSGGQLQRVVIARALILSPEFLVCDEPVSALDVSVQAQVINLLRRLRSQLDLTLLFISHDLSVVRYLCDRVAVMYLGRIVEMGTRRHIFSTARHPYTKALIAAIPTMEPAQKPSEQMLRGEPANPLSPPQGCGFHPRCPIALDKCRRERPRLRRHAGGHAVACHVVHGET